MTIYFYDYDYLERTAETKRVYFNRSAGFCVFKDENGDYQDILFSDIIEILE